MLNHLALPLRSVLRGAGAGLVATALMSGLMLAARRFRPMPQLPPETIARRAAEEVTGRPPSASQGRALGSVAHLAFGATTGALFGAAHHLMRLRGSLVSVLAAVGFANAVYLVSYQGWIPALRILPPATDDDPERVRTMVVAHWVYGSALGWVMHVLSRRARR